MGVRGDDPTELRSRAHDLWIVDERLAFTRAFSSDKRLDALLKEGGSGDRPDVLVWDCAFGMGVTDPEIDTNTVDASQPLRSMMVVEFKKTGAAGLQSPRRPTRAADHKISFPTQTWRDRDIRPHTDQKIAQDCIFYCYVIADIVGDLELQLSNWETTANGQGRIRPLKNQYHGSIEVIQWQDLINEAWQRNKAMLHAAGLSRSRSTPPTAAAPSAIDSGDGPSRDELESNDDELD